MGNECGESCAPTISPAGLKAQLPTVQVWVNGKELDALVDTDCTQTIVTKQLVKIGGGV